MELPRPALLSALEGGKKTALLIFSSHVSLCKEFIDRLVLDLAPCKNPQLHSTYVLCCPSNKLA